MCPSVRYPILSGNISQTGKLHQAGVSADFPQDVSPHRSYLCAELSPSIPALFFTFTEQEQEKARDMAEERKEDMVFQDEKLEDAGGHPVGTGTSASDAAMTRRILLKLDFR
jgi:hypothetical protein